MRRLSALERYAFDTAGYVVLDGVLGGREVARLRRVVEDRRLPPPGDSIESQRFGWESDMLGWDQALRDLIDHPAALGVLADLVGPTARLDHAYGIAMGPGTSGLGLHGPSQPFDPAQFFLHRGGRMWNGLVALAWSLVDAGPGDGGFGCIPGSHRAEEARPPGAESLVVEVPLRAGSLLVFTEALAHCTLPWRGPATRLSLLYKYSPGNSAWDRRPAVPPDVLALLTGRQRLLAEGPYVGGRRPSLPS